MIVYCYTNLLTNKKYVGKTEKKLKYRDNEHQICAFEYHYPSYFYRALRKYGRENFHLTILDTAKSSKQLCEKEIYWIKKLKTFGGGYNMTPGGENGCTTLGRKFGKYSNKRIQNARNGRISNQIPYIITHPNGIITVTQNMLEFCKRYDLSQAKMSLVIHGKIKHHKQFMVKQGV